MKERGTLNCGISEGVLGFSTPDDKGGASGFDADFCRSVAAAVLGDANKVKFVPLSASDRFNALKSGQIDLLSRNSTWTMGRETELGLAFPVVTYFDGQGFLLPKSRKVTSALELDGSKVCVQAGTTTEDNLVDFFDANGMTLEPVKVANAGEALKAYADGTCNVLSSDISQLYGERLKLPTPTDHMVLPDVISKEPLAPVVRADDMQWFTIVKWVAFALINAEELGVTSRNTDEALKSQRPDVRRLVGQDGRFGEQLGLTNALGGDGDQEPSATTARSSTAMSAASPARHSPRREPELADRRHPLRAPDPLTLNQRADDGTCEPVKCAWSLLPQAGYRLAEKDDAETGTWSGRPGAIRSASAKPIGPSTSAAIMA